MADKEKELATLRELKGILKEAKQVLNDDLTKLAIKKLPIMQNDAGPENANTVAANVTATSVLTLSQSTVEDEQQQTIVTELEPLDLDL